MTLAKLGELAKGAWRPLTGYAGAGALLVGLFMPDVTPEKMLVIAGVVGGMGYLRSSDKKVEATIAAATDQGATA